MEDKKYPIKAYLYDRPELSDQIQYWSNDTDSCSVEIAFYATSKDIFSLENKTVSIVVDRADGSKVTAYATVTGKNTALWQLTSNELTVGTNKATIQVYSSTERLTFGTFKYKVLVDPEGGRVTSETNYPILVQLINDVQVALNSVSQTNENISQQELTRETNESNRVLNETSRVGAENTRVLNETSRVGAENTRVINENARNQSESGRENNEQDRHANEETRQQNESARVLNENKRVSSESVRVANEEDRTLNEVSRKQAENTRASNENIRQQNETTRVNEFKTIKSDYETYKNVMIAESNVAALQSQINNNTSQLADIIPFIGYTSEDIYGIEVDISNNKIIRLGGAVGKNAGSNFDNIKAFNRRRCILTDDRVVLAYYGETGYTETGAIAQEIVKNGITYPIGTKVQVMVEQPKFYYRRVPLVLEPIQGGIGFHLRKWRDYISDYPKTGLSVHPNFVRNGEEYNCIYLPAFEGSIFDTSANTYLLADEQVADFTMDKLCSIANAKPCSGLTQNLTLPNSRKLANNRGEGWQLIDVLAHYAEVLLMSIEYATFDFQTAIGLGVVNKTDDGTSNLANNTGSTSALGNKSGMATGTNGLVSISYRGRENPWGNIWKWYDGLNVECKNLNEAYWSDSNFVSDIKTTPYKNCGSTLAKTNGYTSAIGYSKSCDFMYLPSETLGASNRPLNDYYYQYSSYGGFMVAPLGGIWNYGSRAGACCLYVGSGSGSRSRYFGAGLLCIPKK